MQLPETIIPRFFGKPSEGRDVLTSEEIAFYCGQITGQHYLPTYIAEVMESLGYEPARDLKRACLGWRVVWAKGRDPM